MSFFPAPLKTIGNFKFLKKFNLDLPNAPTIDSLSEAEKSKFENRSSFLPQTVMSETKKTHIIVKSIDSSLRSESKIKYLLHL